MPGSSDYPAWRERLAEANDPAFWPIEAIDAGVQPGGGMQFWCDGTSALVTRIVEYPGGAKVLEAIAACGDGDALISRFAARCEAFARSAGLDRLEAKGRLGWLRKHPDGWKAHQVIIIKELA